MRTPLPVVIGAAMTLSGVVGCSREATPNDFRKKAEAELLASASTQGITLSDVRCDTPGGTSVGTVFGCTASGDTGEAYEFDVLIDAPAHLDIRPRG